MTAVPVPSVPAPPQATSSAELRHQSASQTLNALLDLPAEMELRQIELIYRAEGNANLVLALPQFKKVLRLPKMISSRQQPPPPQKEAEVQQKQAEGAEETGEIGRAEEQTEFSVGAQASTVKAGDLTMPDFMAYIGIMRRLLGNEFVCGADIVAIPKEDDRFWINEHIRAHRPVARLDKEFVGPFGLLLPDVTQLPATFDVLLGNLQAKGTTGDATGATGAAGTGVGAGEGAAATSTAGTRGVHGLGDTYAIEIKPKQGWLQLASDVNDLFDLMPAGAETMPKRSKGEEDPEQTGVAKSTRDKCKCRYCAMQLLKLRNGKIKRLGDYCPLELFSGAPSRMLDALNALFACPQNNLRVFQDGNLIYGDHANSISFDELHSRVFPGEIMVLIKHLLVACLLREYEVSPTQSCGQDRSGSGSGGGSQCQSSVSIGEMETKAGAGVDAGIGDANVAWAEDAEKWHADFVNAGQSYGGTRPAAEKPTTQWYTMPPGIGVETTAGAVSQQQCGYVLAEATQTETQTETETQPTPSTTRNENENPSPNQNQHENQREGQINKAEIFRLPKNCVLQKILNLQFLVKQHFDYMWRANYARHSRPTYDVLRGLLALPQPGTTDELQPEQAYLLGATALDCSIMLTFQEVKLDRASYCTPDQDLEAELLQPWLVSLLGHHFLTKLSVLDLDPKPDSHFHKFIEQTCEIEKCCRALN
ncbi:inositol-pentakisphosphate 2-kinase [Drosophila obscura]|uniref:inositol-pentakisphosphate 2-kinase n=1 Tax=Drosophila obscura TaxID=7282 RepID=UPI001BB1DD94|nr:inositol-pentakisphosphate 2-kinase [Drosophila obscura]XP_022228009.2 inositol-pentakisphosphate 2-kinase [Drosophila obscura]XP_022228010.2 inositol-pentakisphosphate 2-kinase [Drosophila obscura]